MKNLAPNLLGFDSNDCAALLSVALYRTFPSARTPRPYLSETPDVPRVLVEADPAQDQHDLPYPKPAYACYVLVVLTFVYVFSFIDRQVLSLLVGPVRRDLGITDTEMSLLIGIAFAAFYVGFGIPLGRIADSRSRRGLITAGFALWSTKTFPQLALMRMGVGVGEASLSPAAYSLITDYFPPRAFEDWPRRLQRRNSHRR